MTLLNLRKIMKDRGMGNKTLSEKSGVPLGTLNKIIYGDTSNPTLDNMRAIARALDCTLDDFVREPGDFFNDKKRDRLPSDLESFMGMYAALDAHGKEIVDFILKKEFERCSASTAGEPDIDAELARLENPNSNVG